MSKTFVVDGGIAAAIRKVIVEDLMVLSWCYLTG